jgi:hypothetical protein
MERCFICWDQGKGNVPATHECSYLHKPLCAAHASHCAEDGHQAIPLPQEAR